MKKLLSILIAGVILFGCCTGICAAMPDEIMPLWDNISDMQNAIYFTSTDGTAKATVRGISGTTSISATLTVYKQTSSGGWEYVDSDSDTVSGKYLSLTVDFTGETGAYYKSVFSVSVTRNGTTEPETKTAYKTC